MSKFAWAASLCLAVQPFVALAAPPPDAMADEALIKAKVIATSPSCVMAPGPKKKFLSCNGFSMSELTRGMSNYSAEMTSSGGQVGYINVHSHDPMTQLNVVGSGDNWSRGRRPSPPEDYIKNSGDTAGLQWTASPAGGSVGVISYDVVSPPLSDLHLAVQGFLANIKGQLSGGLHGKLVQGGTCRVADIDGEVFAIIDTLPTAGQFVQSVYCVGVGGGPLLSMTLYMMPKRIGFTWQIVQVGGVPVQSPPRPLTRY